MTVKSKQASSKNFVFRKHSNIGAADAIDDKKFLSECFVDTGELDILTDINSPQCIVTGRTGAGKTALLEMLDSAVDKSIKISPEGLALAYVSDNEILNFFIAAGVNMDLFYRLLWRHVFAVELIREHYQIISEKARDNFLIQIMDRLKGNKSRQDAINYFLTWGDKFWMDSEFRVKEVTKTLAKDLRAAIDGSMGVSAPSASANLSLSAEMAKHLTEEQKAEIVQRGQKVVDSVQMKALSEVMELLESEILVDKKRRYFITIDRLDENWVNDDLRYHLIRALLDTVREFNNKISNVKIIVAIREDLLDRVFRYTRSPGYQEEKYKSMYLPLTWNEASLEDLVDRRVNQLVREQYTTKIVKLSDLLPNTMNRQDPVKYMMARTMLRPRDIIMFFNDIIQQAEGKAKISQTMISQAETAYSEDRLRALADEWSADYQNLIELILFLKKYPNQFQPVAMRENIQLSILDFLVQKPKDDFIFQLAKDKFDSGDTDEFMKEMFKLLHKVGVIGVKQESFSTVNWSYQGKKLLNSDIDLSSQYFIHPAFWRVLGITNDGIER